MSLTLKNSLSLSELLTLEDFLFLFICVFLSYFKFNTLNFILFNSLGYFYLFTLRERKIYTKLFCKDHITKRKVDYLLVETKEYVDRK